MATFVVQVQNATGTREFVRVTVFPPNDSAADAREKVTQNGWIASGQAFTEASIPDEVLSDHPNGFRLFGELPNGNTGAVGGGEDPGGTFGGFPPGDVIAPGGPGDDEFASGPGESALAPAGENEFRFSQFLRGLQGRGVGTTGLAGRARQNQFRPLQARFLAGQALNEIPGVTDPRPQTFAEFAQTQPLAGANANIDASNLFGRALGAGRGIDPRGSGFENLSLAQQELLNPQNSFQAQRLGDLALASARSRLGASAEFLPGSADLFARFGAQGNEALSFGDFLNQQIFGQQRLG